MKPQPIPHDLSALRARSLTPLRAVSNPFLFQNDTLCQHPETHLTLPGAYQFFRCSSNSPQLIAQNGFKQLEGFGVGIFRAYPPHGNEIACNVAGTNGV
jgi:hypothetical protein